LPDKMGSPACYAAMDRLMNREETTHARVLASHRERTLAKMQASPGVVLILRKHSVILFYSCTQLTVAPTLSPCQQMGLLRYSVPLFSQFPSMNC
jgi:hypothetical protein